MSSDRGGSWLIRLAITSYSFFRSLKASASRNSPFRRTISVLVSSCALTVQLNIRLCGKESSQQNLQMLSLIISYSSACLLSASLTSSSFSTSRRNASSSTCTFSNVSIIVCWSASSCSGVAFVARASASRRAFACWCNFRESLRSCRSSLSFSLFSARSSKRPQDAKAVER